MTSKGKPVDGKKSVVIAHSSGHQGIENLEGAEETEITATIQVAGDDWWGWVVVASAFTITSFLDGIAFTFGSMLTDISNDLQISVSLITLLNSIAVAVYFMAGPLCSALINRYGFRAITMAGSVICSFSLCISSLVSSYAVLVMVYGLCAGFGFAFINMAAALVAGFYFEKLRSLALSIATGGSSVGVMVCYPLNSYLVKLAGWRSTMLLHSGMMGTIYFLAMAFRPLVALNVTKTVTNTQDPTKTVTFLPNLSTPMLKSAPGQEPSKADFQPSRAERLFNAVQNTNYPTAAAVVEEPDASLSVQPMSAGQPGPSTPQTAGVSRITITAIAPKGVTPNQLRQVTSMVSRGRLNEVPANVEINIEVAPEQKRGCCGRCCHWDEHMAESRPMYRDDAFYTGKVEKLPEYQKSRAAVESGREPETGLEYQLAVSRAAAASDLAERRGVFTTAVRRVLATMLDPKLLQRKSYLIVCISGIMIYLGYLVPFIFIQTRNLANGVDRIHCDLFVSVIGGANAVGRFMLGALAVKIDPLKMYALTTCIAGMSTIASCATYNVYFQYGYCVVFGYCLSGAVSLRSIILVALFGLEKLTNATGMLIMFEGIGCLIGPPLSSVLESNFGYLTAFAVAGSFITVGGLLIFPVKTLAEREDRQLAPRSSTVTPPFDPPPERERRPSVIQKPLLPVPPSPPPPRNNNPFRR